MNYSRLVIATLCALVCALATSCRKNNGNVWDDNSTAGNYKGSARSLWGNDEIAQEDSFFSQVEEDFVALKDEDLRVQFVDNAVPQPKNSPGEWNSRIPGIDGFHTPSGSESAIFKTIHFNTDEHTVRTKDDLAAIDRMASYLKSHPNTYLFVTGNCDARGAEAYNLSLGARRANAIRTLLVQKGVDAEQIHTISYGKERPIDQRNNAEAWAKNRRAEFKIYKKS